MGKLTLLMAALFAGITVLAVAMDTMYPEGFQETPKINKKSLRERSVGGRSRSHVGFMHGK